MIIIARLTPQRPTVIANLLIIALPSSSFIVVLKLIRDGRLS